MLNKYITYITFVVICVVKNISKDFIIDREYFVY